MVSTLADRHTSSSHLACLVLYTTNTNSPPPPPPPPRSLIHPFLPDLPACDAWFILPSCLPVLLPSLPPSNPSLPSPPLPPNPNPPRNDDNRGRHPLYYSSCCRWCCPLSLSRVVVAIVPVRHCCCFCCCCCSQLRPAARCILPACPALRALPRFLVTVLPHHSFPLGRIICTRPSETSNSETPLIYLRKVGRIRCLVRLDSTHDYLLACARNIDLTSHPPNCPLLASSH